jgi:hypothetical protein
VTGPSWVSVALAGLMLIIAACCAARLVLWRRRGRVAEPEADGLHVLMGASMAGMLEPRIALVPSTAWLAVFAVAALWFGGRFVLGGRAVGPRCAHPGPHAVESAAMVYMLMLSRSAAGGGTAMAGMSGPQAANPALILVLVVFMIGYVLWTTDQLAGRSGGQAAPAALAPRFAACYKITMSAAMGYMLLTML